MQKLLLYKLKRMHKALNFERRRCRKPPPLLLLLLLRDNRGVKNRLRVGNPNKLLQEVDGVVVEVDVQRDRRHSNSDSNNRKLRKEQLLH